MLIHSVIEEGEDIKHYYILLFCLILCAYYHKLSIKLPSTIFKKKKKNNKSKKENVVAGLIDVIVVVVVVGLIDVKRFFEFLEKSQMFLDIFQKEFLHSFDGTTRDL